MKRYAIVRVGKDGSCVEEFVCSGNCNKCNYGDTKEQLLNKIETALRRTWLNEDNQSFREVAEEIVEFLGVE